MHTDDTQPAGHADVVAQLEPARVRRRSFAARRDAAAHGHRRTQPLEPEPFSDESVERRFDDFAPRTAWRILARNRARTLYEELREAEQGQTLTALQQSEAALIRQGICRALAAATFRAKRARRIHDWYSGAGIETTRAELDLACERSLLVGRAALVRARFGEIDAALRNSLQADDPRLTPAIRRLAKFGAVPPAGGRPAALNTEVREEVRSYLRCANAAGAEARASVRSLRNLLIVVGGCVILVLGLLAALHAIAPDFIDLGDHSPTPHPDAVEVWEVEAVGGFGGLIAAVFTISRLGGFSGPYRLPVYQALIRVPAGAAVALAAVMMAESGQIRSLTAQSGPGILAVALLFGYAPDILLRFMDQRATTLLAAAKSKDDPARPALSRPSA